MEEDDTIYNAMIWALLIGIIIVIITLIVARPDPEKFSELYFENHKELPNYISPGTEYEYEFTITNHERENYLYNISIKEEYYRLDFDCEPTDLYLEQNNISVYDSFLPDDYLAKIKEYESRAHNDTIVIEGLPEEEKSFFDKIFDRFNKDTNSTNTTLENNTLQETSITETVYAADDSTIKELNISLNEFFEDFYGDNNQTINKTNFYSNNTQDEKIDDLIYIPSRKSETNDPKLLIKEENYSVSFSYEVEGGAGQIAISLNDVYGNRKYAIIINELTQQVHILDSEDTTLSKSLNITRNILHRVGIVVEGDILKFYLDGDLIYKVLILGEQGERKTTGGFLQVETTRTYANIFPITIKRLSETQRVNVRFTDTKYTRVDLIKNTTFGENYFTQNKKINLTNSSFQGVPLTQEDFVFNLDNLQVNEISNITTFYAETELNLTSYTLEFLFRFVDGEELAIGLEDGYEVFLNFTNFVFRENETFIQLNNTLPKNKKGWHRIRFEVDNKKAEFFFDSVSKGIVNLTKPYPGNHLLIQAFSSQIAINAIYIKDKFTPSKITYNVQEEEKEDVSYTYVPTAQIFLAPFANLQNNRTKPDTSTEAEFIFKISDAIDRTLEEQYLKDEFNSRKIGWDDYKISLNAVQSRANHSVEFLMADINSTPIYSVKLDNKENTIAINYVKNGTTHTLKNTSLRNSVAHSVDIDVEDNNLTVKVDGKSVFTEIVDKSSNGVFLTNASSPVDIQRLDIQDKNSYQVRKVKPRQRYCRPTVIKYTQTEKKRYIEADSLYTFKESFTADKDLNFDVAKITVELSQNQEIHFWVKRI